MRHPYFKEAREADAKRTSQANAEGAISTEGSTTASHETQKPKKQMELTNSVINKHNQPLVKTLPSIGVGSSNDGGVAYVPEPTGPHAKINGATVTHSGSKHNTVPLFNTANHTGAGAVAGSSLPPIAGNGGDQSSRSNRSLQQQQQQHLQQQSAQKKKKKNATTKGNTYAQQVW
jgi:hypothetical protein